jgi:hypothetical protein
MGIVGTVILVYVALRLAVDLDHFDPAYGAQVVALPVWLTLGSLPFIYGLGLYAAYDKAFTMLSFHADDRRQVRRAKLALMLRLHIRARLVGEFNMPWQHELLATPAFRAAWHLVGEFIREQKRAAALAAMV